MGFIQRLKGTFQGDRLANDLQSELDFHIEERTTELVAEGKSETEGRRLARLEFGNSGKLRDETRDADIFVWLENWLRDTRQSLRGLRRRPVFAITTIASLAIGIGAVASLFSVADAVVWKPIALPNEHELYDLQEAVRGDQRGSNGPRLKDWQTLSTIAGASGFYSETLVWRGPEGNESIRGLRTYTGVNATMRPKIALGRTFTKEEENGELVALVTNAFWRHRLSSVASLGDRTLELSGSSYRIVGVLDDSIGYPEDVDVWIPATPSMQNGTRQANYLETMIRLKPGVPVSQVQAEVNVTLTRLAKAYPKTDADLTATLAPFREQLTRGASKSIFILLSVVACVLAMICVNIAALLLTRAAERERESALRSALGASPSGLIRLYLIETMLLALAGGALGVMLAHSAVDFLKQILPADLPRLSDAHVDSRVLAFALGVSLLAALASGLAPAWLAARKTMLQDGARGASAKVDRKRLRAAFVIIEIALSVLLVTTGMRLAQAFYEATARPKPFQTENVVTATVPFPWSMSEDRINAFTTRALERFSTLPGVTKVGVTDRYPLLGGSQDADVRIEGLSTAVPIHVGVRTASAGYFDVLNVPLLEGRMFSNHPQRIELVANEAFAKRYLHDGRPVGAHRIAIGKSAKFYDIVGVIADIPQNPARREADPDLYLNYANSYWPYLNFAFRTTAPASVLAPLIREEVAKLDGTVLVKSVAPMKEKIGESAKDSRVRSALVGASAGLALLLMAIGIHGLIAGDVATRWREFGVRLALGATVPSIRALLVQKLAALAAAGVAIGVVAVLITSRLLEMTFAGLPPVRTLTVAAVALAIVLAAITAILWPLRRIASIDAATALRHE